MFAWFASHATQKARENRARAVFSAQAGRLLREVQHRAYTMYLKGGPQQGMRAPRKHSGSKVYAYYTHTIRIPIRKLHICFKINDFRHVHRRNEISLFSIPFLRVNCPNCFILNDLWSLRIGMRIVCVWYAYNMRIVCVYLATGMLTGCTHSLLRPAI